VTRNIVKSGTQKTRAMDSSEKCGVRVNWNQKFTDFAIVLKSGQKLGVHQFILANNSEVFEAMLTKDMEETSRKEMSLEHFEDEAVIRFLEYLYAGKINDPKIIQDIRAGIGTNEYIYKRNFDCKKLSIDLLEMAHMYEVKDLEMDCVEYLKKNICDNNVMEVWMGAESLELKGLVSEALNYLLDRPQGKTLKDVPGFTEALQMCEKPIQNLIEILSCQNSILKASLKEELKKPRSFNVTVIRKPPYPSVTDKGWTAEFCVLPTDKIGKLIQYVEGIGHSPPVGKWGLSRAPYIRNAIYLNRDTTFRQNDISSDTTLHIWTQA